MLKIAMATGCFVGWNMPEIEKNSNTGMRRRCIELRRLENASTGRMEGISRRN